MSHLIAHGRCEVSTSPTSTEMVNGHAFLNDDGTIEIIAESWCGNPENDTRITFQANAVEAAVVKRIRGRARG